MTIYILDINKYVFIIKFTHLKNINIVHFIGTEYFGILTPFIFILGVVTIIKFKLENLFSSYAYTHLITSLVFQKRLSVDQVYSLSLYRTIKTAIIGNITTSIKSSIRMCDVFILQGGNWWRLQSRCIVTRMRCIMCNMKK